MDFNFTGSLTQRNINLGSRSEVSSSQLAQHARDQRAARQELKRRQTAATRIQAAYRGSAAAGGVRGVVRRRAEELLASLDDGGDAKVEGQERFEELSRLIAKATGRPRMVKQLVRGAASTRRATLRELQVLRDDDELLLPWARVAAQAASNSATSPSQLQSLIGTILFHLLVQTGAQQATYQPYLELLLSLCSSPSSYWSKWTTQNGLYPAIRSHLLSFVSTPAKMCASEKVVRTNLLWLYNCHQPIKRDASPTLRTAIFLLFSPLEQHPTSADKLDASSETSLRSFLTDVLTIPNLSQRIPLDSLQFFVARIPFGDICRHLAAEPSGNLDGLHSTLLLANMLALCSKRVPHLADGASVKNYLIAVTKLQDAIPAGVLVSLASSSIAARSVNDVVDRSTLTKLLILPSNEHLAALLAASGRYPTSCREAFCAFLASTLYSWDSPTRESVLSAIAIGLGGNAQGSTMGGLVRELWRGWIRSSSLSHKLSTDASVSAKRLASMLTDQSLARSWPCLVMLVELYSRSLLTMGDDEFYPDSSSSVTLGSSSSSSTLRNALTLDEVVSLSSLLRNLAFGMFWFEGSLGELSDLDSKSVAGMRMTLLSLRNLAVRLLQQIHQRDSRRQFTPEGHWLMTNQWDLQSFIQSVVMEEKSNLESLTAQEQGDGGMVDTTSTDTGDRRGDGNMDIDDDPLRGRSGARSIARAISARQRAFVSPRIGVLNNIPFVVPFTVRVEIFREFVRLDAQRHGIMRDGYQRAVHTVTIRRTNLAEDGFVHLNRLGPGLKNRFEVRFIDQFGQEESGIDGGGLFKEFLTSLVKEAFDTDRGLWRATEEEQLYPNPHSYAKQEDQLEWYRFLGRMLGKALYEGILIDVNFASFFLSKWLGKQSYLDDVASLDSLDKTLYRNLMWLKHYPGDVEKELALDFTVTDDEFGVSKVTPLRPGGATESVTRSNRLAYIYLVAHYRLSVQISPQCNAFLEGLTDLIDLRWLQMLDREELRELVSGTGEAIDLVDLQKHTHLSGYHEKDEVVQFFWRALESFDQKQRKAFLKFVTSCPSAPLLGFSQLNPQLAIRHSGDDPERLPTASTCVNLLKLPRYATYEQCRQKLLYAIQSEAGFDLS